MVSYLSRKFYSVYVLFFCLQSSCRQRSLFDLCPIVIPGRSCSNGSICVEDSDHSDANCVSNHCVQVEGSDLMAFSLTTFGREDFGLKFKSYRSFPKVKLSGVFQEEQSIMDD